MKTWGKYIRPYWPYFVLGPLCMIVEVVGEVLMPKYLQGIIDDGAVNPNVGYILGAGAMMVITALLMMLGGVGGCYFGAKAAVNFGSDLRQDLYDKVQSFSFANIDRFSTGSLVTRLTNDVTQLQNFVNMLLRMCLRSPGMLIGALIMAIRLKPDLSLVLCVTIPCMVILLLAVVRIGMPRFTAMQDQIDRVNATVQESVTNVRVVKSFVREDFERRRFGDANARLKAAGLRAMDVMVFLQPIMMLFMNLTTLAVVWFGGNMVVYDGMSVGTLTAFITYITQILMSLTMISMIFISASRAMASGSRIREVMEEKLDLSDENAAEPDRLVTRGEIEFRDVSFRFYKSSEKPVLDHISFRIQPGQTVGIIGSTGCGKSALVSLIPRLYDCDEGRVLVDGVDVRDYSLHHLREGVGMVLQKNVLFSGTIEENLRWGDREASEEALVAAADAAQADKFVRTFPDGYDTELGQGGTNVSGGQKQRLCIARALLKKPKILILDDSTSAVDTATEARIRESFRNELKGTTKILIAQRITSVMDADVIVVMDDGRITGVGRHEELLATNRDYQEIYASQMDQKEVRS